MLRILAIALFSAPFIMGAEPVKAVADKPVNIVQGKLLLTLDDSSVIAKTACEGGQIWTLEKAGQGAWKILLNSQALTASGNTRDSQVKVDEYRQLKTQQWQLKPQKADSYMIINLDSGLILAISSDQNTVILKKPEDLSPTWIIQTAESH